LVATANVTHHASARYGTPLHATDCGRGQWWSLSTIAPPLYPTVGGPVGHHPFGAVFPPLFAAGSSFQGVVTGAGAAPSPPWSMRRRLPFWAIHLVSVPASSVARAGATRWEGAPGTDAPQAKRDPTSAPDGGWGGRVSQPPSPDTRSATVPASARCEELTPATAHGEHRSALRCAQRSAPRHPTAWHCWLPRAWPLGVHDTRHFPQRHMTRPKRQKPIAPLDTFGP